VVISLLCGMLAWLLTLLPFGRNMVRGDGASGGSGPGMPFAARRQLRNTDSHAAIVVDIHQWSAALPLWADEEAIALNLRDRSIGELASVLWLGQSAPFGWMVLERAAMSILGTGEAALRAIPLLFGIATVVVAVWVGRRWMGRIAALCFVCCVGSVRGSHYRFGSLCTADLFFEAPPVLAAWAVETNASADHAASGSVDWLPSATGLRALRY
jgi:hypothetical protein